MSSFRGINDINSTYGVNFAVGLNTTVGLNSTNSTLCPDAYPQNEVSAGSVAFIAIALLFGCMTQISGSLITSTCNRFWRICPLMNLLEGLIIFFRIAHPLFNSACTHLRRRLPDRSKWHLERSEHQGNSTARPNAYALLAERLGNSRGYDYWLKQQNGVAAPTLEQILGLLDDVAALEDGATLRPVVVVPMILQFVKLCIIKGGFWEVKALPLMYFCSWFWVEILLLLVHGKKLGERDMLEAERVLLLSVAPTEVVHPSARRRLGRSAPGSIPGARSSAVREDNGATSSALEDAVGAGEAEVIELPTRREEVSAQSNALLAHTVGEGNVPNHRLTFRGNRVKLSAMQGSASNWMYQRIWGNMAGMFDGWWSAFILWMALGDTVNDIVYFLGFLVIGIYFPLYFLDMLLGVGLATVAEFVKKESQHFLPWTRDWVAFRVMVALIVYFTVMYSPEGTSKPEWLDWLG